MLKPNSLLIDFRNLSGLHCWQLGEIDGDKKYLCVVVASIVAKYHHDQETLRLHNKYPQLLRNSKDLYLRKVNAKKLSEFLLT